MERNPGDPYQDRAFRVIEIGDKVVIICDYEPKNTGAVGEITAFIKDHNIVAHLTFADGSQIKEPLEHVLKLRDTLEFE